MENRAFDRRGQSTKRKLSQRMICGGFKYPFGVFPETEFQQKTGYDSKYLKEEECFYYQIALPHDRLMTCFTTLIEKMLGMVYLVVKVHSGDYYREYDTYVSGEMIEKEKLLEWLEERKDVVLDDGFFGVGMFSDGGTEEVFLDEHKTFHVYHSDPALMEQVLEEMGIPFIMDMNFFWNEPHYHEPLPLQDGGNEINYLTAFEDLADKFELYLDEEDDINRDEEGVSLGMICWKVEIRGFIPEPGGQARPLGFYSTLYVNAESREEAVELVESHLGLKNEQVDLYLKMARVPVELLTFALRKRNANTEDPCVWFESERIIIDQP